MIESVRHIGVYLREKDELNLVSILTETSSLKNVEKVVCLIFSLNEKAILDKITIEDFDINKSLKYLFRSGTTRGTNITPIAKITDDIRKTLDNKIINWFKENHDKGSVSEKIWRFFDGLSEKSKVELDQKLISECSKLNTKKQHLLTIKIGLNKSKEKYIGEIKEFEEVMIERSIRRFSFHKSKGESKGDGFCLLCGDEKNVLGFASPFAFYTLDQPGFAYNFNQKDSWKQLPICLECALDMDLGKQYLDEKLVFPFFGYRYYFIPKFVFTDIDEGIMEDIDEFSYRNKPNYLEGPLIEEENWQSIIQKKGDVMLLVFLFFETQQTRVIIKQYVEDVLPSWLKTIIDSFNNEIKEKTIYQEDIIKDLFGSKATGNFKQFRGSKKRKLTIWSMVREFYPSSKIEGIYDKYFIDIVGDILKGKTINERLLVKSFVFRIRSIFRKRENWNLNDITLQSLLLLSILKKIELIKGEKNMEYDKILDNMDSKNERARKVKEFLIEHKNSLNSSEKKALFLQGVLTRFLLAIQYQNLRSEPFREKLYGMQLDKRKIKKLFPQTIEKLREYKVSYKWLEEAIANYLLLSDNKGWSITNNEISYYFNLGLTLGQTFKSKKKEETYDE